jgi:hypothetical protein
MVLISKYETRGGSKIISRILFKRKSFDALRYTLLHFVSLTTIYSIIWIKSLVKDSLTIIKCAIKLKSATFAQYEICVNFSQKASYLIECTLECDSTNKTKNMRISLKAYVVSIYISEIIIDPK